MASRMGFPVTTVRVRRGNDGAAPGKDRATTRAIRDRTRLARPGTAFCSWTTTGRWARLPATTAGTLTNPPIPTTTSAPWTRGRTRRTDPSAVTGARSAPTETFRTNGRASISTKGNPAAGTSLASCPVAVPAKVTSAP